MKRLLYLWLLLLLAPLTLHAQDHDAEPMCPLFTAVEFEGGGASLIDTYLSDRCYNGWDIGVSVELMKTMKLDCYNWVWQQRMGLNYGESHLVASGNGLTIFGGLDYAFAMMRRTAMPLEGLQLYYGGDVTLMAQGIYNYHGGNNPVSVKADLSLGLTGMVVYNFALGKLPITARYQMVLPVIGIFAQPQYGQSYYEVSLGHYDNFLHCGTWGNRFDIDNRLTLDLHFDNWALRVGYHNRINTTYESHIRYQMVLHNFTIGFAGDLTSLNHKKQHRSVARALYTLP